MKPEGEIIGCDKLEVGDSWEEILVDAVLGVLENEMPKGEKEELKEGEEDNGDVENVEANIVLDGENA